MSKRLKVDTSAEDVQPVYANIMAILLELLQCTFMYFVAGRGSAKTTEILARRLKRVVYEMPGCYVALVGDTYMNLMKNVVPSLCEGLERMGWHEGVHFVVGVRPPEHFKKPYKKPQNWKHTITFFSGVHVKLVSMDRPSTGAGDSYQHLIGDESKYIPENKLNKLTPAIRGEHVRFQNCPLYRGRTFTTDMPNPNHREHDWILKMKQNMNPKAIMLLFQTGLVVNEIRAELYNAKKVGDAKNILNVERKLNRWIKKFDNLRTGQTFYCEASSYVNANVLTERFYKDLLDTMDFREVKTSVLSIKPKLSKGEKFYPNISRKNFYKDSYNWSFIDSQELTKDGYVGNSLALKYIQHSEPLEIGLDTGNMLSLVIGQPEGEDIYRVLKFMHTITPEWFPQLGKNFRDFFTHHENKNIIAYCDRASNNYQDVGDDHASKFKKYIEEDEHGNATEWTVTIMTRHQATISHQQEYDLLLSMCLGSDGLPLLKLPDSEEGKPLKASLEIAKQFTKEDKNGKKTIHKVKTSEKLEPHRLLMESTNPSDGLKYLLCRPEYLVKLQGQSTTDVHITPSSI